MKISVIIPVHNSEQYLRECLNSVLEQSFIDDYEVICSVNNTTDSSLNIIKQFQEKYSNLKYIELGDVGVCVARLEAIRIATGEYIAFLDSDDYYDHDYLRLMYQYAKEGNYDVVNCSFRVDKNGKIHNNSFTSEKTYNKSDACKQLLLDKSVRSFLWTKLIKREFLQIDKLYYPKGNKVIFEDIIMLYGIFMSIDKLRTVKTPLYFYRNNPNAVTKQINKSRFENRLLAYAFIRYISDQNNDPIYSINFRKTFFRTWLNLWFDAFLLRKAFHMGPLRYLYSRRKDIKKLKSKKHLPIKNEVWEKFINDTLSNPYQETTSLKKGA